jgi:hypothetical protein
MESTLADLDTQEKPNYWATAMNYGVARTTCLTAIGQTTSRKIISSEYHQRLTIEQEEVLIDRINRLTDRGVVVEL